MPNTIALIGINHQEINDKYIIVKRFPQKYSDKRNNHVGKFPAIYCWTGWEIKVKLFYDAGACFEGEGAEAETSGVSRVVGVVIIVYDTLLLIYFIFNYY